MTEDLNTLREALEHMADDYPSTAAVALEALSRLEAAAVPELSREDVVRLAREAGARELHSARTHPNGPTTALRFPMDDDSLQRFASLVRSVPVGGRQL